MKPISVGMAAVAGVILLAGTAAAIEPWIPRNGKIFAKLDADRSGKVTLDEIKPRAEQRFAGYDTDGDGAVSTAEIDARLKQALERRRNRILAGLDEDKNGSISKAELDKFVEAMFNGADADDDGGITLDEARAFRMAAWRKKREGASAN
jgi:Ca2+-binding EF-hand superfamily protein